MTHSTKLLGTSVIRVKSAPGRARLVELPLRPDAVPMGVRDEVAQHYGLTDCQFQPMATTLDYLVGAAVACLTGSFGGRLGAIGQQTGNGELTAEGTGSLVVDKGVIKVRAIHVAYTLDIGEGIDDSAAQRAHNAHTRYCPVTRSIGDSLEITKTLSIRRNH